MNISVDDILDELRQSSAQKVSKPITSMDHIDDIIKEILEKRQNEEIRRENRPVSLREKMELEEEIKAKTRTLTIEIEKLKQNHDKRLEEVLSPPQATSPNSREATYDDLLPHLSPTQELSIMRLKKAQQIKYKDNSGIELSQEIKTRREQKYDNLKKVANNEHLLSEMKHITDHFGNFKMDDKSVEDGYEKLAINPHSYRELKSNRSRVVDAFVLDPQKPPVKNQDPHVTAALASAAASAATGAATAITSTQSIADEVLKGGIASVSDASDATKKQNSFAIPLDAIKEAQEAREERNRRAAATQSGFEPEEESFAINNDEEYDYNRKSQRNEILGNLQKTLSKVSFSAIVFAVLSVLSLCLVFSRPSDQNILLAASFPVTPRIYSFVMLGLLLATIIAGFSIFSNAFHSIAEKKPDKDILYSISIIIVFLSSCFISIKPEKLLDAGVVFYVPILVTLIFFNFISKRISLKLMIASFEKISGDEELYAASPITDQKAIDSLISGMEIMDSAMILRNVKTGFVRRFLAHSCAPDYSDNLSNKLIAAVFPVTIIIFALAYFISRDLYLAISLGGATPLCLTGVILPLLVSLPLNGASGIANHFAGAMPNYEAIDTFNETDGILIEATDIFPKDSVLLHGIKTFKGKRVDNAIIDAASVICSAKSVLAPVFLSIIASQVKLLKPVDSIVYEDSMGISAWVDEKRVLIGNRSLMINHSIAVPKEEYEQKYVEQGQELIYLSCEGELSAAFVVEFVKSNEAMDLIDLLQKSEVAMLIRSVDSAITTELVERVFDITGDTFKILPSHMHRTYEEQCEPLKHTDGDMVNNGGTMAIVVLTAICKRMSSCIKLGGVMQMVGAIGGALLLAVSAFLRMPALAGGIQLLIFMGLFGGIYWLYQKNIKL